MDLFSLIIALIIVGLILYLLNMLPIDATIKQIIHVVVIVVVIIWLLSMVLPLSWHIPIRR